MKRLNLIQVLILLIGTVLGNFIGTLSKDIAYLSWLNFGDTFGISPSSPFVLDIGMFQLMFGFEVQITLATILGLLLAIFLCRKFR